MKCLLYSQQKYKQQINAMKDFPKDTTSNWMQSQKVDNSHTIRK